MCLERKIQFSRRKMRENRDSEAAINSELAIGIDIQLMKIDLNEDLMG